MNLEAIEGKFQQLADLLFNSLSPQEHLALELYGENSHFSRFNRAKVRQTGRVTDYSLKMSLMATQRSAYSSFPYTGNDAVDTANALEQLEYLRQEIPQLPEDPYLVLPEDRGSSREVYSGSILPPEQAIAAILAPVEGLDFTGCYAGGNIIRALANSAGQFHWFATLSSILDYSLITPSGKAVKGILAGKDWQPEQYQEQIQQGKIKLAILEKPPQRIEPGRYRTYFAPDATADLLSMFSWGAVSESSLRQGGSALAKMRSGKHLSPLFTLQENFSSGTMPRFNELGEIAPETMTIIAKGELINTLVSSRTAKEYGLTANGASMGEGLRAGEILPGTLSSAEILPQLGTGLYLSNLHYLNWSDRQGGRITGMTRYACFWVENGEIIAPIKDLRFDESLYAFFGDNLRALTNFQEFIPNTNTYERRGLGGLRVPGMIVDDFTFTL